MKSYKLIKNQKITVKIQDEEFTYIHPVEYIQDVIKYHHGDSVEYEIIKIEKYEGNK
jgi:hypothetical protein